MCSLFRNKYRVESSRWKDHDYSSGGNYFITIRTAGEMHWFGDILNQKMFLSESGQIAYEIWHKLPEHFAHVSLDEFVVMPNHVHGIVIINPIYDAGTSTDVETLHATSHTKSRTDTQETLHATSLRQQRQQRQSPPHTPKNDFMATISPKPGSLATIIRSYKSAVAKNLHKQNPDFSWQPRYYDHLIRSEKEMIRIRKYIIDNPLKWDISG